MTTMLTVLALSGLAGEPVTLPEAALPPISAAPLVQDDKPTFSYTFVEANYLWTDIDGLDDPLDGWEVRGSIELPLNLFIQGSYSEISDTEEFHEYRLGLGWHLTLGKSIDAYGILSVAGAELEDSAFDADEDGIAGEVGARFLLGEKIELNGRAEWVDVDGSEVGFGAGGRFYFNSSLSAGLDVGFIDESESYSAGLRFEF